MKTLSMIAATFATIAALWTGHAGAQQPAAQKTAAPQQQAADPAAMARGARLWGQACAQCHNPRDPKDLSDEQWRVSVSHMRIRAGLTGQEARDILRFLQTAN